MDNIKRLSCSQAKQKDMVDYLAGLGHHPTRQNGNDYWYYSPLRIKKTASFKICRKLNCWYDHGTGKGGNLIDFGILYHHCTVKEFLQKLDANVSFQQQPFTVGKKEEKKTIQVLSVEPVTDLILHRYLYQRRIAISVAERYCRQVLFSIGNKQLLAIGFKNNKDGFELRSPYFKGSSSPKSITTITNGSKNLSVFEGFFNFMSLLSIQAISPNETDFLVLSSAAFFEKSIPVMNQYKHIRLYLDRDEIGQNCTRRASSISHKYVDESKLYAGYIDINEWMTKIGNSNST